MKNYPAWVVFALLLCVALSLRMNLPMTRSIPLVGNVGPMRDPGIRSGPTPLTPQQRAAFDKAGKIELAARAAKARGDYARAGAYYRAETQVPHYRAPMWTWIYLGLMLDYQGKKGEAWTAYQKGFGPGNHRAGGGDPTQGEAVARFGVMCEDRGLHADACECYYASRTMVGPRDTAVLGYTLNAKSTSSSLVRSLLSVASGLALEQDRAQPDAEALAAFQAAVRLAPGDPRPWYFLAYGLRRAGRFGEAEAALREVSRQDKDSRLEVAVGKSLAEVHAHSRDW